MFTAADKEFFSALAIVLTFALFVPYILSIRREAIRPHVFSWATWGLGTFIVFLAQLVGGAGVGAWPLGISAGVTIYVAWLAFSRRSDITITRSDWYFFVTAVLALPLWFLTSDPLSAVLILTVSDLIGFAPTLRKAYYQPHEESVVFFAIGSLRNTFIILALEEYSMTTVLFPAVVGVACLLVSLLLSYRRSIMSKERAGA